MTDFRDIEISPEVPPVFATLADVKEFLSIATSDTGRDSIISKFNLTAAAHIEAYCNTLLAPRTVVETLIFEDTQDSIALNYGRATALTAVTLDGVTQDVGDYRLARPGGVLMRTDGAPVAPGGLELQITYTAGFATMPATLADAAKEYVRDMLNGQGRDVTIAQEATPDVGSVTYASAETSTFAGPTGARLPAGVAALVAPYVSWFRLA